MAQSNHQGRSTAQNGFWKIRLGLRVTVAGLCLLTIVMGAILAAQSQVIVLGILGPAVCPAL